MWVWFLAAAPVMLVPLQWRRRARWSLEKILLEEKQPRQRFWLNPSDESFRWGRRRLQAREIGSDLIWMWFLAAASVMSLLLQWRRKTCWSSREDLARGEDLVRSGICFGFCIWFCSWVFGGLKEQGSSSPVLEAKGSKTKSSPTNSISIWQNLSPFDSSSMPTWTKYPPQLLRDGKIK